MPDEKAYMSFGTDIFPKTDSTYDLGTSSVRFANLYVDNINGTDVDELGGGASIDWSTATIPTTGWSAYGETDLVTVTVTVSGLTANDNGIIGLVQSGTESTDSVLRDGYAKITRITTAANSIVVYATAAPTAALPVKIGVFG